MTPSFTAARGLLLFAVAVACAGCLAPEARPDLPELPSAFSTQPSAGERGDGLPAPEMLEREQLATWWEAFGDGELVRLVEQALAASPDTAIAEARVRRARALAGGARADRLPRLDAGGAWRRERLSADAFGPLAADGFTRELTTSGLEASWELDLFGGLAAGERAAHSELGARLAEARGADIRLAAEVARALIAWRASAAQLVAAETSLASLDVAAALARARFDGGLAQETDALTLEAARDAAAAELAPLRLEGALARERLAALLGFEGAEALAHLDPTAALFAPAPHPETGIPAQLLTQRPDLLAAALSLEGARARVDQARVEYLPRFELFGAIGAQASDFADLGTSPTRTFSVGPGVRWRLFDFGRIANEVEARRAELDLAHAQLSRLLANAVAEVEGALADTRERRAEVTARETARNSAERAWALASSRYERGLDDFSPVLEAERTRQLATRRLITARRAELDAQVTLFHALGGGWTLAAAP